jgi:hypothetical protein
MVSWYSWPTWYTEDHTSYVSIKNLPHFKPANLFPMKLEVSAGTQHRGKALD